MSQQRQISWFLVSSVIAVFALGCTESVGLKPGTGETGQPGPAATPELLRWPDGTPTEFNVAGPVAEAAPALDGVWLARGRGKAGKLLRNVASFWAVRGESRSVQIEYRARHGRKPFMRFTVSDPTFVPGVGELAVGDSVLITIGIDQEYYQVVMEPTGLQFGTPATLQMWYDANVDLNGDGKLNRQDDSIKRDLMTMWYQEYPSDPWTLVPTIRSPDNKSLIASLEHFCIFALSEYAVSW